MKLTFFIVTLSKGGAQRVLAEITDGLAARGHDVTIVMPPQGAVEYETRARIIRTAGTDAIAADFPYSDALFSNFYTTVPVVQQASELGKGVHIRFSLCYEPAFLPHNEQSFPSYQVTDKLLSISQWQQQLTKLLHGVDSLVIPVGVSPVFRNLHIRKPDPLQISVVFRKPEGGFSWHREQDYVIRSLQVVKQQAPHVQINMISPPGEYYHSPELQRICAEQQFQLYTPADDIELNYYYNLSHIFVSSSVYDTFSMPGLEAMKCGNALATVYSGGNMDYCRPGENCLLSYRYENRLSADILQLVQDEPLRRQLAAAGAQEAGRWTWERAVDTFARALETYLA